MDRKAFFRDWIVKQPIGKPGDAFEYNNSNYNLLAWIIEEVSGQPFHEFLTEHIFSRPGMANTSQAAYLLPAEGAAKPSVWGYERVSEKFIRWRLDRQATLLYDIYALIGAYISYKRKETLCQTTI